MLEVAYHHGEGVGADDGADAVDAVLVFLHVGFKGAVNGFLQSGEAVGDLYDSGAENFHAGNIGGLLLDVYAAHVDVAFETEVGGGGSEGDAVLTGTGFSDNLFLAHVLGEKGFTHAVVQLVGAAVVQILALGVNLDIA